MVILLKSLVEILIFSDTLDYIERVASTRIGRNVGTTWRFKQSRVVKETSGNENMFEVVCLKPDLKCFCRETTVAHGNQALSSGSKNSTDFFKDFLWFVEVINADDACYFIERCILKWKLGIFVEIFCHKVGELRILTELVFVHSEPNDLSALEVFGVVGNPRTANVENILSFLEIFGIVFGQCGDSGIVNVVTQTRSVIKNSIVALVLATEIGGAIWPLWRPLGVVQDFFRHAAKQSDRQSIPGDLGGNRKKGQSECLVKG